MLKRRRNRSSVSKEEQSSAVATEALSIVAALNQSQAVIEFELDGNIVTANEKFLSAMGYRLSELKDKNHRIFMHPDDVATHEYKQFWNQLRSGEHMSTLCRRVNKRGEQIWLQANYNPILDGNGTPYKIVKIATDVTNQQLERAASQSQVNAIMRAQAVIEFDLDGTIRWANDNFLNATGYELAEIKGKHHRIFVNPEQHHTSEYSAFWQALNRGEFVSDQFERIKKDGSELWLQATYNPILDPSGNPATIMKFASDITEQKQHENNLNEMLAEAAGVMAEIASGDLTHKMHGQYNGSLATLSNSINQTIAQLETTIGELTSGTSNLQQGSQSLMTLNEGMYNSANNTAKQTDLTSATAQQISSSVDEVASALGELVTAIREISKNSADAVSTAEKAVVLSENAKETVTELSDSSTAIGAVIKTINSIADQTNLLALNATIEAARAGDAGKGFAVVANEVKELAKETARATEEVSQKISKIQTDSQSAARIINEISETIETISAKQNSIATTVEEQRAVSADISRSIDETAVGTKDIAKGLSETAEVARESLRRAEQSQTTACELSNLSDNLSTLASYFTLISQDQRSLRAVSTHRNTHRKSA